MGSEKEWDLLGGNHPGKVVGAEFEIRSTKQQALVIAVHAGHYFWDKQIKGYKGAGAAIDQLHERITKSFLRGINSSSIARVIVAGDFNELGTAFVRKQLRAMPCHRSSDNASPIPSTPPC